MFSKLLGTKDNRSGNVVHNPYINVHPEHISSNAKTKFDGDADVFDLCGIEFKKELATNISKANKTEPVEVHVTGPFLNSKIGKGHYCVLGACWGTEELGWRGSRLWRKREVMTIKYGFENYEP